MPGLRRELRPEVREPEESTDRRENEIRSER
jgi:hypothetical protein